MKAAVLLQPHSPFEIRDLPVPVPADHQLLIKVSACGLCRTDLHIIDGELASPKLPLVCGHQIVGRVAGIGRSVRRFTEGMRIGVPWLGATDGSCYYCRSGSENLCLRPQFTGYTIDGGFAEYAVADARYCFTLPECFTDVEAAPLLCAGFIGYRALRFTDAARYIGLYGFGAAAHLVAQVAVHQGRVVYAFTRENDAEGQRFARSLGASWAGASTQAPPHALDAAIIFAPLGDIVPLALKSLGRGGVAVCAGIHMSDIPSFPYELLWGERTLRSVANLTRRDGEEFLTVAAEIPLKVAATTYSLLEINRAVEDLRAGRVTGSAVITLEG
jgi:alcohol dehydrogenase, propanol-preferring